MYKYKNLKLRKFLGKLSLTIAQHAFLACLFLFLLALVFGTFLFYKYYISAQKAELGLLDRSVLLREKAYQEVLRVWQEQEKRFEETDFKEYPDPFMAPASEEELTE